MRLFSLDTSFSFLNFSVIEDGKVVLCHYVDNDRKTLEHLPLELRRYGIEPETFDAYAVSLGVGYATSLRIGITFLKTLAYLQKKPIVGYENLKLMCLYTPRIEEKVCALKVSSSVFYRECKGKSAGDIGKGELPEDKTIISLKGQGLGGLELEFFPFSLYGGLWAYERLKEGYAGDNPFSLEPIYLRPGV
jgi:tRNA A37 threonylcarbamoyladenosine modification protein TsaB